MSKVIRTLAFVMVLGVLGCDSGPETKPLPAPPGPLTLQEWKALPVQEKYDGATFDRLRKSDPKLRSDQAWDRFFRAVVIPERKKDLPAPGSKQ